MKSMSLSPQVRKSGRNGREHVANAVRMPVQMSDRLRQLALENERSLNAEIVYRIALGLGEGADELAKAEEQAPSVLDQMARDIAALLALAEKFAAIKGVGNDN
ncbi:MAG: Arc family DNA-binding protein [Xanthomonadaceae bacterium]|nr:Arc family DNA-binding protein [Xanthomonadaceae bacterium]